MTIRTPVAFFPFLPSFRLIPYANGSTARVPLIDSHHIVKVGLPRFLAAFSVCEDSPT